MASKSANKVFIIQSIDRQLPFEDIIAAKGMEMDELYTEIETIIASGMVLNIDYYIRQTLDDDVVEEIYEWFRTEATSDSLEEAIAALGGDYEEDEIRLVRIKFLSEVAN